MIRTLTSPLTATTQEVMAHLAIPMPFAHTCTNAMASDPSSLTSMNVSLPEELRRSAERLAESKHFASVSEYVRHLIRADLAEARRDDAEKTLVTTLAGKRVDRRLVLRAMQELTKLRESKVSRGTALTLEELRAALDEASGT